MTWYQIRQIKEFRKPQIMKIVSQFKNINPFLTRASSFNKQVTKYTRTPYAWLAQLN